MMDEDGSYMRATPKHGIRVPVTDTSPVPVVEPSISLVPSDTESHPGSEEAAPSLKAELERLQTSVRAISRMKNRHPIRISDKKGYAIINLRKSGLSYPKIARELGIRVGGVRSFLRRRGLTSKQRIGPIAEETLKELYCVQGLSMGKIAERLGLPHTNVEYWMGKFRIARRPLRKYVRNPFSGDDYEKAYMIGFRQGDLHAKREGLGVRISGSTTHPAQISLFRALFEKYGHVYVGPVYNRKHQKYFWQMVVVLDDSFSFLMPKSSRIPSWIKRNLKTALYFAAGFFDAEGSISVTFRNRRKGMVMEVAMMISNSDRQLLEEVASILRRYKPHIYLSQREGTRTGPNKTYLNQDQWQLAIYRRAAQERLLDVFPIKHQEKVEKAKIAREVLKGCDCSEASARIERLWQNIDNEVTELAQRACEEIERRRINATHHTRAGSRYSPKISLPT